MLNRIIEASVRNRFLVVIAHFDGDWMGGVRDAEYTTGCDSRFVGCAGDRV